MLRKEYIVVIMTVLLSIGLAGMVFAADNDMVSSNDISTEAGNWQSHLSSSNMNINQAARNTHHNDGSMAYDGSEAGNWEYRFDTPETKADVAANRYNYDHDSLSAVGTEAGDSEFTFDNAERDRMKTICSNC